MARHCPECGFVATEGASYCARSGANLGRAEGGAGGEQATTATYVIDEQTGELRPPTSSDVGRGRRALVVRSGRRPCGQHFLLRATASRSAARRAPTILLDDITVSREHARVVRRPDGFYIEDADSLNGTYVNRRRVESHRLTDGDELQIGKFKLTYLER